MKQMYRRHLIASLILIAVWSSALGQRNDETTTFFKDRELFIDPIVLNRYSQQEFNAFATYFDRFQTQKANQTLWSGTYFQAGPQHWNRMEWKPGVGFVGFSIFSCRRALLNLNFGDVEETEDTVRLFPHDRPTVPKIYVKVRWKGGRFLVAESSLLAFAETAAGIYVEPDDDSPAQEHTASPYDYWGTGWRSEITDMPVLPARYKSFQRQPIITRILGLVSTTRTKTSVWGRPSMVYRVKIEGGKNWGLKQHMSFAVGDADDLTVEKVGLTTSFATITRPIDEENSKEMCSNKEDDPCPRIKPGLPVKSLSRLLESLYPTVVREYVR